MLEREKEKEKEEEKGDGEEKRIFYLLCSIFY